MKNKVGYVAFMIMLASIFIIIILFHYLKTPLKPIDKEETNSIEEYIAGADENDPVDKVDEGDAGEDEEFIMTINSKLQIDSSMGTKASMVELVINYSGYIPYADGQHYYGLGYFKSPDGINNVIRDSPIGMDSLGYVIFVYRNTFGYCDPLFNNPLAYYEKSLKIKVSDLQVGDVGMYTDKANEKNHFGIFIGYEQGIPVFSHCANLVIPKYPSGNDRLSFLKSEADIYYLGNEPVELNFFFRPDMPWKIGGEKNEE